MSKLIPSDVLLDILGRCTTTPTPFHGLPDEDLRWLGSIEACSCEHGIPAPQYADVALYFMKGDLKSVMEDRKRHLAMFGMPEWDWEDFKGEYVAFCEKAKKLISPGIILETPSAWEPSLTFSDQPDGAYVQQWLGNIENGCQERHIPKTKWAEVATHFLTTELRAIMNERKQHLMLFGISEWLWEDFKREFESVCEDSNLYFKPERLIPLLDSWNPLPVFVNLPGDAVLQSWFAEIDKSCEEHGIPPKQWTEVAIHFLQGDMKTIMEERKAELVRLGSSEWAWDRFKKEFASFCGIFTRTLDAWSDPPVFSGAIDDDPTPWLDKVAKGCQERQIPDIRVADAAVYFINGSLRQIMEERKIAVLRAGASEWSWEEFKGELLSAHERGKKALFLALIHSWSEPPVCSLVTDDYGPWLQAIERGCRERNIPQDLYADAAVYFLRGELKKTMDDRKGQLDAVEWTWDRFQQELLNASREILQKRRDSAPKIKPIPEGNRSDVGEFPLVTAAAGLNALTSADSLPAVVFAVTNMSAWFRRTRSRR